jgi:hypothetical protein
MYHYFVYYEFTSAAKGNGQGMAEYVLDSPITAYEQLMKIVDTIKKSSNLDTVVIANWKLLREE